MQRQTKSEWLAQDSELAQLMKRSQKMQKRRKRYLKRMHPKGAHGRSKKKLTRILKKVRRKKALSSNA